MVQSTGAKVRVQVDTEAAFGTTPGVPNGRIMYAVSSSLSDKRALIKSPVLRSSRLESAPVPGNLDVSGALALLADAEGFGFMLLHLLGTPVTTGANPYVHTFKAGNVLPAGMVLEHDHTDQAAGNFKRMFNGVRVNNLNLTLPQEGQVTATFDLIGQKVTAAATSFDATPTDLGHSPFSGFDAIILEGGGAIATITDASLTITNNLDGNGYTIDGSGGSRSSVPEGMVGVSGTFNALFDSTALYDKAVANTTSSLQITLSRGTGAGTAGNESVAVLLPELKYEVAGPEVSGPQGILLPMNFTAFYDVAAVATSLQAIVKNQIATY